MNVTVFTRLWRRYVVFMYGTVFTKTMLKPVINNITLNTKKFFALLCFNNLSLSKFPHQCADRFIELFMHKCRTCIVRSFETKILHSSVLLSASWVQDLWISLVAISLSMGEFHSSVLFLVSWVQDSLISLVAISMGEWHLFGSVVNS